jgi:hypothetical protein
MYRQASRPKGSGRNHAHPEHSPRRRFSNGSIYPVRVVAFGNQLGFWPGVRFMANSVGVLDRFRLNFFGGDAITPQSICAIQTIRVENLIRDFPFRPEPIASRSLYLSTSPEQRGRFRMAARRPGLAPARGWRFFARRVGVCFDPRCGICESSTRFAPTSRSTISVPVNFARRSSLDARSSDQPCGSEGQWYISTPT